MKKNLIIHFILVLLLNIQYFSGECNKAILLKIDFNNFVINA